MSQSDAGAVMGRIGTNIGAALGCGCGTVRGPEQEMKSERPLRIAIVAPVWFEVPPDGYGGIEMLCASLVEGLLDLGHDVTLVAAGRDRTRGRMIRTSEEPPQGLGGPDHMAIELSHALEVASGLRGVQVDVIHDHTATAALSQFARDVPTVVTAHLPATGAQGDLYKIANLPIVAVSHHQRQEAPDLPWLTTIHNAVDVGSYPFVEKKEDFALFLGRIHPQKAPHLAIDSCREVGLPLVIAGKCSEPVEKEYFAREIAPRMGSDIRNVGVAGASLKRDLLGRASVLIFPIQWEEPFGLVMVEAMACGTPVVATRRGAVPEIVTEGVTGFLCDEPWELAGAIERARQLDPNKCREDARQRFDVPEMAARYEAAYRRVLDGAS